MKQLAPASFQCTQVISHFMSWCSREDYSWLAQDIASSPYDTFVASCVNASYSNGCNVCIRVRTSRVYGLGTDMARPVCAKSVPRRPRRSAPISVIVFLSDLRVLHSASTWHLVVADHCACRSNCWHARRLAILGCIVLSSHRGSCCCS